MAEFPSLPLFTDAFLADTGHLTAAETGAYLLLLMMAWRAPGCMLPDDDVKLARWARLDSRTWGRLKPRVMEFWTLSDGNWTQKRLLRERDVVSKRAEVARRNGSSGGRPKSLKNNEAVNQDGSSRVTQKKAPNPNPNPISREDRGVEDARAREPEPRPDQVGTQAEQVAVADEAAAFARAVRVALGSAPLSPNEWRRIDARVAAWIANGWPQVVVLDVIRERCANSRDPPRTLGYLEQVIAGEIAARSRPLPEVVALPAKTVHAAPAVRAYSVRDQAEQETRNALAKLREFATGGGPRGAADPRCLPHDPGE